MKSLEPLISVIIPVYNVEKHIDRCLASVTKQTYANLEIILIDDGSTDDSYLICEKYKKNDNRVKLFHKDNSGVSSARNDGIKYSNGLYIMFLDSDDELDLNVIEILYNDITKTNSDITNCNIKYISSNGIEQIKKLDTGVYNNEKALSVMLNSYVSPWGRLYKKIILDGIVFKTDIHIGEDLIFVAEAFIRSSKISFIDFCGYKYYTNFESATNSAFSAKKFEHITSRKYAKELICSKLPDLETDCDLMILVGYMVVFHEYSTTSKHEKDKYKDEFNMHIRYIKKMYPSMIKNMKSIKNKILLTSFSFMPELYLMVKKIKNAIRK